MTTKPESTTIALPKGVRIVTTKDAAVAATKLWGSAGSAIDEATASAMVIVAAPFGRNAVIDPKAPHVGIGKGHVRPFIDHDAMTCRVCRHTMTASAFPTLSVPTADGRTRNDRCRACRDAKFTTNDAYVKAGSPDRGHAVTASAPVARRGGKSTRTRTTTPEPVAVPTTGDVAPDAANVG